MKFSLILNSRGRVDLLNNLLYSIQEKTADLSSIECLVSCDNDDQDTYYFAAKNLYSFAEFEFIERDQNLHRRLNSLALRSIGEYIWVLNDDCEIQTDNWDEISYPLLIEFSKTSNIIYGRTFCTSIDGVNGAKYASFPMISHKAVDTVGYFMDERAVGLGGDVIAYRLYSGINRIIDLPIKIRHILHETVELVANPDITAYEMRQNTYKNKIDPWNIDISEDIKKLQKFIYN